MYARMNARAESCKNWTDTLIALALFVRVATDEDDDAAAAASILQMRIDVAPVALARDGCVLAALFCFPMAALAAAGEDRLAAGVACAEGTDLVRAIYWGCIEQCDAMNQCDGLRGGGGAAAASASALYR